ncbi:hypothetical protein JG687_00018875 [Phytophthora cactorum]|uniref:Uncharacterized protein n=1 Tax=Phytophthora cactorum TaxID=29920 RepID=A0A8T1TPF7_9STRA|nr:hypothetical protein JG687_00018875 [Phytophthora cactorum]
MGRWLAIKQNRDIIEKSMEYPRMTHSELAGWAAETFKLSRHLPRSTVSDTIRRASTIMSADCEDGNRRKALKVASIRLEKRRHREVKSSKGQGR